MCMHACYMVIFQRPVIAMTTKQEKQLSLPGEIKFVYSLYKQERIIIQDILNSYKYTEKETKKNRKLDKKGESRIRNGIAKKLIKSDRLQ